MGKNAEMRREGGGTHLRFAVPGPEGRHSRAWGEAQRHTQAPEGRHSRAWGEAQRNPRGDSRPPPREPRRGGIGTPTEVVPWRLLRRRADVPISPLRGLLILSPLPPGVPLRSTPGSDILASPGPRQLVSPSQPLVAPSITWIPASIGRTAKRKMSVTPFFAVAMDRPSPTGTHVTAQGETLETGQTPNNPGSPKGRVCHVLISD